MYALVVGIYDQRFCNEYNILTTQPSCAGRKVQDAKRMLLLPCRYSLIVGMYDQRLLHSHNPFVPKMNDTNALIHVCTASACLLPVLSYIYIVIILNHNPALTL